MHFCATESLVHLLDKSIDVLFTVAEITAFNEMPKLALVETTSWVRKLERPEEVVDLLEVWSNSEDLVNDVFDAYYAEFTNVLLNQSIVSKRNALLVDLSITTLVNEFTDGLEIWVPIGDIWLNDAKHLNGSLGEADKDTIVDLEKAKKL